MKALWLTSWYPHKKDRFTGDFIQRHAFAASIYTNIHVIHIQLIHKNAADKKEDANLIQHKNLSEQIVLLQASRFLYPFNKIVDYLNYIRTYKKYIRLYLQKQGKPGIVHVHVAMKAGLIAVWLKKRFHIPFVVTEHWTIYNSDAGDRFENRNFLFRYLNKLILKNAYLLLPVSNNLGNSIYNKIYPVPYRRILNAVDTNVFKYLEKDLQTGFSFLHVSTMNAQKNPQGILKAFSNLVKQVSHAKLYMVGPADSAIKKYAESLNIPAQCIEFTGEVTYTEVALYMRRCNALVMFSNYENMPCVILEALCCGLPVITTKVGGVAEIVTAKNGYLFPAKDEVSLCAAMTDIIVDYKKFNQYEISITAQHHFSYEETGKEIAGIYKKISFLQK